MTEEIMAESRKERIFNVMPPVKTFTGRTGELVKLHQILQKPPKQMAVSQCAAISGLGGAGKTELARKYAWEYHESYEHIIWINCGNKRDTLNSFAKLAEDLKVLEKSPDDNEWTMRNALEKDLQSILPKIFTYFKTLLIFDNVDQFEDIKGFLLSNLTPAYKRPAIIITSRNSDWDIGEDGDVDVILLNEFTLDEAERYVKQSLQINDADKSCDFLISGLIETFCYFPLTLHQAVSCIKSKKFLSRDIQELLREFRDEKQKENLLKWSPKRDRYTRTMFDTWLETSEKIKKENNGALAIRLVEIMSYLGTFNIRFEDTFVEIEKDEEKLKEAISILVKYSIIKVQGGKDRINKFVQMVVRLWLKDKKREEEVLRIVLAQVYKYLRRCQEVVLWSYACNYTTLIDEYFCKTYEESTDRRTFIPGICSLVKVGNVLLIRKILDHFESKSDLWHKLCSEMFREERVKCNHKDPSKEDTCHETHVKNIFLFHTEVNKALKTSKTEELKEFLQSFDKSLINSSFEGGIALHNSIEFERGNLDVVKMLVENGADIDFQSIDADFPLSVALKWYRSEIANYLLDQGANPNPDVHVPMGQPIHYAAMVGYVNIMRRLAGTKEARESLTEDNWTPLHFAAEKDRLKVVEFLISKGVDVTAMTDDGETACHIAVEKGNIRIVKYLIDNKLVDVNLLNRKNETLLHTAASRGQLEIVQYLRSMLRN